MIIGGPLHGAILQLVGSLENCFARFPMIISEENFRKDVRAEFEQLKKYIAEFEEFLDLPTIKEDDCIALHGRCKGKKIAI